MIEIGKEWRIVIVDERNVAVERLETVVSRQDKTKRKDWVRKGYHGNLKTAALQVLNDATRRAIGGQDRITLQDLIQCVREAELEIVRAVGR